MQDAGYGPPRIPFSRHSGEEGAVVLCKRRRIRVVTANVYTLERRKTGARRRKPEGGKVTVRVYPRVVGVVLMVVGNQWAHGVSNTK